MRRGPPAAVWLSFLIFVVSMVAVTAQAMMKYQLIEARSTDGAGLVETGQVLTLVLGVIWLVIILPSIGSLFRLRFCRVILASVTVLGVVLLFALAPLQGFEPISTVLTFVQLFAAGLLYTRSSRAFFDYDEDAQP